MSLVQSNRNKSLNRGPNIKPKEVFKIDGVPKAEENPVKDIYVPGITTLKIDTRIRDMVNTLSLIGYADTQREVLEKAISEILENMSLDEKRKFDVQYQVLEDKTRKTLKNK